MNRRQKFKLQKYLGYLNLPVFGLFIYFMGVAGSRGYSRIAIFGIFICYAFVRVLINLWINKESVAMVGDLITNIKKVNKIKKKRRKK